MRSLSLVALEGPMRAAVVAILFVPLLVPSTSLSAQQHQRLESGQRVRVTVPSAYPDHLVGTVVAAQADTLVLLHEDGFTSRLGLLSIDKLEVWRRRPGGKGALKGAAVGLLTGAAVGGLIELVADGDQAVAPRVGAVAGIGMGALMGAGGKPTIVGGLVGLGVGGAVGAVIGLLVDEHGNDLAPSDAAFMGAGFFGVIGFAVGTIVGYSSGRWEEVPLDHLRLSIVPLRDGRFALGLSISF